MKLIDYIVAHKWKENLPFTDPGNLGTYTFGSEIHTGTKKQAKRFLEYVKGQSPDKEWKIYKIKYKELNLDE